MKNDRIFQNFFLFTFLIVNSLVAVFGQQQDIVLNIEEPESESIYTGVSNIRGYALARTGITRIELYVNSHFISNIPFGGLRTDVGAAFPDYQKASESGFSMAYNYSNLQPGQHTLTIKAIDKNNVSLEKSMSFRVTRFDFEGNYLNNSSLINLDNASVVFSGNELLINKLLADGKIYDIQLQWRSPSQDFDIKKIMLIDSKPTLPHVAGTWVANTSLAAQNCLSSPSSLPSKLAYSFILNQDNNVLRGTLNNKDVNLINLGLSGGVLVGGNFVLVSRAMLHDLSTTAPGCYSVQTLKISGDFSSSSVQVLTSYSFGQPCPADSVSMCQLIYLGTITQN